MRNLVIDERWRGEHGIGRFATEVLARLDLPWTSLNGASSPTAILDFLNISRIGLGPQHVVFTPGFNAGFTRAKQLIVIHDLIHLQVSGSGSKLKTLYYNLVVKRAVLRANAVMTVSEASATTIRAWIGDENVDVSVVGNGSSAEFVATGTRREFIRPTLLYVGNMKAHKNVDVILGALSRRPEFHLVIVTSDVVEARDKAQAAAVTSQVTLLTGLQDVDLASLYRGVHGLLQPSILEGFGLPTVEAMSCGTAVAFWTGCESVKEICAGTGVGVESSTNEEDWANAFDRLLLLHRAGPLTMPSSWLDKYDWDRVALRIQEVISRHLV